MKDDGLRSYHFSLGNSFPGPVGYCASVRAYDAEGALAILRAALPEVHEVTTDQYDESGKGIAYLAVYFNPDAVSVADSDFHDLIDEEGIA